MAHSRTARKAVRQNRRRRAHNKAALTAMRTEIKKVRKALAAQDPDAALQALPRAQKLLDKNAKKHRIHPNKAARLKSRLARTIRAAARSAT